MTEIIMTIALWCQKPYDSTPAYVPQHIAAQKSCRDKILLCVGTIKPEDKILQCAKDNNP